MYDNKFTNPLWLLHDKKLYSFTWICVGHYMQNAFFYLKIVVPMLVPSTHFFFFFYILYVFYVVTNNISIIIFKSLLVLQSHLPNIQNVSGITSTQNWFVVKQKEIQMEIR